MPETKDVLFALKTHTSNADHTSADSVQLDRGPLYHCAQHLLELTPSDMNALPKVARTSIH